MNFRNALNILPGTAKGDLARTRVMTLTGKSATHCHETYADWYRRERQGYGDKIISYTLTTIGSLFNASCARHLDQVSV